MMRWEVEMKFPIADFPRAAARLAEMGAQFSEGVEQIDQYFNHPARDFATTDEALRIRRVGLENRITYKGPKVDPSSKTRQELEIALPSGREFSDQFAALLAALGFRPVGVVQKTRRVAVIDWQGFQVELALDKVDGLGIYLELEIAADKATLPSAQLALHSLAQRLEFGPSERRSYLELLLG